MPRKYARMRPSEYDPIFIRAWNAAHAELKTADTEAVFTIPMKNQKAARSFIHGMNKLRKAMNTEAANTRDPSIKAEYERFNGYSSRVGTRGDQAWVEIMYREHSSLTIHRKAEKFNMDLIDQSVLGDDADIVPETALSQDQLLQRLLKQPDDTAHEAKPANVPFAGPEPMQNHAKAINAYLGDEEEPAQKDKEN